MIKTLWGIVALFLVLSACGAPKSSSVDDVQLKQVSALYAQGKLDEALKELEKMGGDSSGNIQVLMLAARVHFYKKDYPRSEKLCRSVFEKNSGHIDAKMCLVRILARDSKRTDEALSLIREILEVNTSHTEAWYYKGLIHERSRQLEEAFASYIATVDISCRRLGLAHRRLADLYRKGGFKDKSAQQRLLAGQACAGTRVPALSKGSAKNKQSKEK